MGELIRRERAADPQAFSGERLTGARSGQVEVEHYHRYLLAREFCRGRDVLDVAAGEGYGAALLAQVARSVVGVEIDGATVEAARTSFGRANLRFEQGDARALALGDASVDVVVSFETLEHLGEQDVFLAEVRRVLRPGGLVVISTPDRDVYSASGTAPNPFHVLELTRVQFEALLRRHFAHVATAGQRSLIGSVIFGAGSDAPVHSYEKRSPEAFEGSRGLARAPYLIALASDGALPDLPGSVYVDRSDLDTDEQVRFDAEVASRRWAQEAAEAGAQAEDLRRQVAGAVVEIDRLQRLLDGASEAGARAATAEAGLEDLRRQVAGAVVEIDRLQRLLHATAGQVTDAAALAARRQMFVEAMAESCALLEVRTAEAEQRLVQDAAVRHDLVARLGAIEASSAWRLTWPLRRVGTRFPRVAAGLRWGAKLAWYSLTLQLLRRYRLRRSYRAALSTALPGPVVRVVAPPLEAKVGPTLAAPAQPSLLAGVPADATAGGVASGAICGSTPGQPDVSIIIATYGQLSATLACLRSIAAHPPRASIEIIVVDDAYPDPEVGVALQAALGAVEGVRVIRNTVNLGFLLSVNHAARLARGRCIHLLNNDTTVMPGAVDALLDLLDRRPDVGVAGSKLLYPDGRLQEAGGILWSDASGWNYGKHQDPGRPEFNYVREVDYCSGASVMIRRTVWEALGGFDEAFAPAYYEDADLAFRVRAQGADVVARKVLYEPRSEVIHFEGLSHGTDIAVGVKAHQVANRVRMATKWAEALARDHYPNGENVMRARDRARGRKVILVLDHYALEPDRDAGSRSTMGIVTSLVDAGWVVKFWPHNRCYSAVYTTALERLGIEVVDARSPLSLVQWLQENGTGLDHAMAIRPDIAGDVLLPLMRDTGAVLSFYGVDLHFARLRRQADLDGDPGLYLEAAKMERLERRLWRQFDVVIYPSDEEAAVVRAMAPGTVARGIVPFTFDASPRRVGPPVGAADGGTLLFVAGFAHPPNVDAAVFLVLEIVPMLAARIGPVRVVLAGSNPTAAVRALAGPLVEVTGYLTEAALAALYGRYRAAVVPLRFGAGVKGKVVEALSWGLPVVTTSIGAQGIPGLAEIIPVHDETVGIVDALERLMTDDAAWVAQSHRQTAFAEERFSRSAMRQSVLAALAAGEAAAVAQ